MENKTIDEVEDNSVGAVLHQGKTIAQWEKILKKDLNLTQDQILKLVRAGVDLDRMLLGLDETEDDEVNEDAFNDPAFKDEKFFFEKDSQEVNESLDVDPEDVITVKDFIKLLRKKAALEDKLVFRAEKSPTLLFDINTKAGITVVDFIDNKLSDRLNEDDDSSNVNETEIVLDEFYDHECLSVKDFKSLGQAAFPHNSSAWESMSVAGIINGKVIEFPKAYFVKLDHGPDAGTVFLLDGTNASQQTYDKDLRMLYSEEKSIKEGRSWRGGGYGGTGRAYSSLGSKAPRGEAIGWYRVDQLDPKAAGKMPGWRCGPSNFPFNDAPYGIGTGRLDPDGKSRKYEVGTMIMRNKHVNAGSASGVVDIAVPSYFAAIKSNDKDAIELLNRLGIPLDLTFGMDPNDDYSVTYTAIG